MNQASSTFISGDCAGDPAQRIVESRRVGLAASAHRLWRHTAAANQGALCPQLAGADISPKEADSHYGPTSDIGHPCQLLSDNIDSRPDADAQHLIQSTTCVDSNVARKGALADFLQQYPYLSGIALYGGIPAKAHNSWRECCSSTSNGASSRLGGRASPSPTARSVYDIFKFHFSR